MFSTCDFRITRFTYFILSFFTQRVKRHLIECRWWFLLFTVIHIFFNRRISSHGHLLKINIFLFETKILFLHNTGIAYQSLFLHVFLLILLILLIFMLMPIYSVSSFLSILGSEPFIIFIFVFILQLLLHTFTILLIKFIVILHILLPTIYAIVIGWGWVLIVWGAPHDPCAEISLPG